MFNLRKKGIDFDRERQAMVETQVLSRGIRDSRVLAAMLKVPRHVFVDTELQFQAYEDRPLGIGADQTISQPYMVALMTEALGLRGREKVLEIGTGSGYQTAILAELAAKVFSLERLTELAQKAEELLASLGYTNIEIMVGDGTAGLKEEAPFDGILVTAGAPSIPLPYLEQLAVGGRLVIPVGGRDLQSLKKVTKREERNLEEDLGGCRFVPLVGDYGWKEY